MAIRNATAARKEFEQTVDELYTDFMRRAARDMAAVRTRPDFDIWDGAYEQGVILCFMAPTVVLKPGYSDLDKCGAKPDSRLRLSGSIDAKLGISLVLVGLEWAPEQNEWKLQVGEGVLVAGTWSPTRGFGFQVGDRLRDHRGQPQGGRGAVDQVRQRREHQRGGRGRRRRLLHHDGGRRLQRDPGRVARAGRHPLTRPPS